MGDLQSKTLYQDKDSAYNSKAVKAWATKNRVSLFTLPGDSPDFLILETMAHPIKRLFYSRRLVSQKAALERFANIFEKEMDMCKINELYIWYTKRLHECRRVGGQMTRY